MPGGTLCFKDKNERIKTFQVTVPDRYYSKLTYVQHTL